MTLPTTDLLTVHDPDHDQQHHQQVHQHINALLIAERGEVFTHAEDGTLRVEPSHKSYTGQGAVISHAVPGALTIVATAATRYVTIDASASINGITVTGDISTPRPLFLLIRASALISINVDEGALLSPAPPATLANGEVTPVIILPGAGSAPPPPPPPPGELRITAGTTSGANGFPNPGATTAAASGGLRAAIAAAADGDIIEFDGDHTNEGEIAIDKRIYLKGAGVGTALVRNIRTTAPISGLWVSDLTISRPGVPTSNGNAAFKSDGGGPLTDFRLFNLEITGHLHNHGIELSRRWPNNRGVIHNVEVHEIENKAYVLNCDNLRTWGLIAHDIYRTAGGFGFSDVDAVNYAGSGHHHSGFWFYGIHEDDSVHKGETSGDIVIPASPGRANPTGPVGTENTPHVDGWQTFNTKFNDNVTPWTTRNLIFEDGVIDYRPTSGNGGSGGRHGFGFSSHNSGGTYLVGDVTVRRVLIAGVGTALAVHSGVEDVVFDDCDFWLLISDDVASATTGREQFSAATYSAGGGDGPPDNPNCGVINSRVWRETSTQYLETGGPQPGYNQTGTVLNVGDPPTLGPWDNPSVQTPSDGEVAAWLGYTTDSTWVITDWSALPTAQIFATTQQATPVWRWQVEFDGTNWVDLDNDNSATATLDLSNGGNQPAEFRQVFKFRIRASDDNGTNWSNVIEVTLDYQIVGDP